MLAKTIQNPEIPGMEHVFSPPPPPPPLQISSNPTEETSNSSEKHDIDINIVSTLATNPVSATVAMSASIAYPSNPAPNSYYITTSVPAQPSSQTQSPWWIHSEMDTNSAYQKWYEASYKAALAAQNDISSKSKNRIFKRKSEIVDPKQDAEKVASAQRELSALMKPLKCDLCNAVMNSTLQAKLHYQGKPHQKKVSMFLNQSVKKVKTEDGQISSTTGNDWHTYCEICKTWFTSQIDAAQHYSGKKHMKAAHGVNRGGRLSKKSQISQVASVDRTFGIGLRFPTDVSNTTVSEVPVPVSSSNTSYTSLPYSAMLRCDLCGISTNRPDQLEIHKRGAKHLKMMKLNGMSLPESSTERELTPTASGLIDYSIYRTPSGQYYCAPCNLSLNSESTFAQHIDSKKHKNQINPKVQSTTMSTPKKAPTKKK